jgi:hypothetical protein
MNSLPAPLAGSATEPLAEQGATSEAASVGGLLALRSRRLKLANLQRGAGIANVGHDRQTGEPWENLEENFEPLGSEIGRKV